MIQSPQPPSWLWRVSRESGAGHKEGEASYFKRLFQNEENQTLCLSYSQHLITLLLFHCYKTNNKTANICKETGISQLIYKLGFELDDRDSIRSRGRESFSSPPRTDRLWGPPSLLSHGYRGMKLTAHLHLAPRLRNVELCLHSPWVFKAWCLVKNKENFTVTTNKFALKQKILNFIIREIFLHLPAIWVLKSCF
jgi:hypothetical protein